MSRWQALRSLLLPFLALTLPAAWAVAAPPVPAAHLALELTLDPGTRQLAVVASVRPGERNFRFALHESLHIEKASVDGQAIVLRPAGQQGDLRAWQTRLPAADATLRIEYQGTLPALDRHLDHRQVLGRLPPMTAVEGSFLSSGSGWYPQPAALFTYRVRLSVPGEQRALVAGRLLEEETPAAAGDRYRASFEFAHPADGIDLVAGPWIVREKMMPTSGAAPLRLRTYFTRELDEIAGLADAYLEDTRVYIERYGREIGAYPFSAFSVVASPLPTGFGMPTLTYLGAEVLKLPFIRATSLGHEILHNWWGNGVYVDYATGNWAEGLTTFMADYAYKESESADAARAMRLGWLRDFAALPPASRQSLASFRSRTHGAAAAVGYGKAAMLFVMLRDLLGEQQFQRGPAAVLATAALSHRRLGRPAASLRAGVGTVADNFLQAVAGARRRTQTADPERQHQHARQRHRPEHRSDTERTRLRPASAHRSELWPALRKPCRRHRRPAAESRSGSRRPGAECRPRPATSPLAIARRRATAADPAPVDRRPRAAATAGLEPSRGARGSSSAGRTGL
jgi:aminopeptidase N